MVAPYAASGFQAAPASRAFNPAPRMGSGAGVNFFKAATHPAPNKVHAYNPSLAIYKRTSRGNGEDAAANDVSPTQGMVITGYRC